MAFKKIYFSKKIERRTYVQGNFTGKYNGSLIKNHQIDSLSKVYDINIYEGKISNVINQVQQPNIINESTYEAIKSHLLLEQKSFQNVTCIPENNIENYDGYKLNITEPKLENVEINDVLKEGDKTFGTVNCKVTGYLIDYVLEEDQIKIEVCEYCDKTIEDCSCASQETVQNRPEIVKEEPVSQRNKWDIDYSWSGFFTIAGLILLAFFALTFGAPGVLILIIFGIVYGVVRFSESLNFVGRIFSWLGYGILGLFFLGILFSIVDKCSNNNSRVNSTEYKSNNQYSSDSYNSDLSKPQSNTPVEKLKIKRQKRRVLNTIQESITETVNFRSVYICNGKYAKRYHLSPYCRGLSNCKSTVSSISLDDKRLKGRSLCGLED